MEARPSARLVATVLCVFIATVAVSATAFILHRSRRRRRRCFWRPPFSCAALEDKPQYNFRRVLADNSYTPFKHLSLQGSGMLEDGPGSATKMHPFELEINLLLENPPALPLFSDNQYSDVVIPYKWIDTVDELVFLGRLLSKEKVFAVDTEQHSLRSFLGYTALMQISTCKDDYLIDTIALHDEMEILRPVFADPSIFKIFHGADNDILWLQRDFHIYVVNMFDTAKACDVLSKPQKSLAYLLETYCRVTTDKTLQREDWRVRPLPAEMVEYARCDAHYLLYIANRLISELYTRNSDLSDYLDDKSNFFYEASRRSNTICLQLYVKEVESTPGASSATSIFSRNICVEGSDNSKNHDMRDLICKLCAWRDLMARVHDESVRFVLSDQAIASLAFSIPESPAEVFNVLSDYASTDKSHSVVLSHINELCSLLQDITFSIEDIFRHYVEAYKDQHEVCVLSLFNSALFSQLCMKQNGVFSYSTSCEKVKRSSKQASRQLFIKKFSCKSPVYHNCRIYASDGRLLCYCDQKKLQWYVQRNLAKMLDDDPPAIVLLFEPKGRPEDEDNEFYIQSKKNMCVGCGEKNHYIRYRIIPSCYRMHFPEHLKSHRSHDIVLLCVDCHETAHAAAEKYKRKVAEEFGIPLFVQKIVDDSNQVAATTDRSVADNPNSRVGISPLQLRSAAMALLRHGSVMPLKRYEELMEIMKAYYGGRELTRDDLEAALLVGMSPNKRKRLKKQSGFSFLAKELNHSSLNGENHVKDWETGTLGASGSKEASEFYGFHGKTHPMAMSHDIPESSPKDEDTCRDNNSAGPHQLTPFESNHKLSLLGHGPHGKQVVDHLLTCFGEEGVSQFCQRWRQVFVEAIHPCYLPSGWNVKHSGRRHFGDYSVYNPTKKTAA